MAIQKIYHDLLIRKVLIFVNSKQTLLENHPGETPETLLNWHLFEEIKFNTISR